MSGAHWRHPIGRNFRGATGPPERQIVAEIVRKRAVRKEVSDVISRIEHGHVANLDTPQRERCKTSERLNGQRPAQTGLVY